MRFRKTISGGSKIIKKAKKEDVKVGRERFWKKREIKEDGSKFSGTVN